MDIPTQCKGCKHENQDCSPALRNLIELEEALKSADKTTANEVLSQNKNVIPDNENCKATVAQISEAIFSKID